MNKEQLRKYLDDFYNGTATPEQERLLSEYFLSAASVDEEFRADAEMFRAVSAATTVPENLERRIVDATIGRKRKIRAVRFYRLTWVAASIAVVMILVGTFRTPSPYHEVSDPQEAKEIALQVTQKLQKNIDKLEILKNINI
ncbi:MAG: hypothetical protein NC301_04975 [Bacteroides sp.]|nr:hypothetical protein [Bacteroides sp.]MCM1379788.1 hypothetical protein [Bacteroides sp.]MCM1446147.1 hypothetical protein [Prevotella sp.]